MIGALFFGGVIALAVQSLGPVETHSNKTGLKLDTLDNEIHLAYEEGKPAYYYSNVFTPVCETGECKPIYINFYWDLMGNYLRFDQPEGEILTKLDHEPFTEEDYQLLDEILRGGDPRYGQMVKHSSPSESAMKDSNQKEKHNSESSPAPGAATIQTVFMSKMEMVDGVSGATLPELRDKFVPGALYTTYTCWDLANTSRLKMADYTRLNLFTEDNYKHFFSPEQKVCREALIEFLASRSGEENGHANVLMSIADSASTDLAKYAVQSVNYYEIELDTVQDVTARLFFGQVDVELKRQIIYKWGGANLRNETMKRLSESLHEEKELATELIYLFRDQLFWPKGMIGTLSRQISNLDEKEDQQLLHDAIAKRRGSMNSDEWKLLSHIRKKFELDKYND